jgi:hypothetical protein
MGIGPIVNKSFLTSYEIFSEFFFFITAANFADNILHEFNNNLIEVKNFSFTR